MVSLYENARCCPGAKCANSLRYTHKLNKAEAAFFKVWGCPDSCYRSNTFKHAVESMRAGGRADIIAMILVTTSLYTKCVRASPLKHKHGVLLRKMCL